MNKEELEKEADEYVTRTNNNDCTIEAYLAGAEPREKRIADLEDKVANLEYLLEGRDNEIDELQEQNTNLQTMLKAEREVRCNEDYLKRVTELEAQIEKMKCCYNCRHSRTEYEHCKTDKHEKWEIKEK